MAEIPITISFEDALEGKHGEAMREKAETAIVRAVEQLAALIGPALPEGSSFATGGVIRSGREYLVGEPSREVVVPRPR